MLVHYFSPFLEVSPWKHFVFLMLELNLRHILVSSFFSSSKDTKVSIFGKATPRGMMSSFVKGVQRQNQIHAAYKDRRLAAEIEKKTQCATSDFSSTGASFQFQYPLLSPKPLKNLSFPSFSFFSSLRGERANTHNIDEHCSDMSINFHSASH